MSFRVVLCRCVRQRGLLRVVLYRSVSLRDAAFEVKNEVNSGPHPLFLHALESTYDQHKGWKRGLAFESRIHPEKLTFRSARLPGRRSLRDGDGIAALLVDGGDSPGEGCELGHGGFAPSLVVVGAWSDLRQCQSREGRRVCVGPPAGAYQSPPGTCPAQRWHNHQNRFLAAVTRGR